MSKLTSLLYSCNCAQIEGDQSLVDKCINSLVDLDPPPILVLDGLSVDLHKKYIINRRFQENSQIKPVVKYIVAIELLNLVSCYTDDEQQKSILECRNKDHDNWRYVVGDDVTNKIKIYVEKVFGRKIGTISRPLALNTIINDIILEYTDKTGISDKDVPTMNHTERNELAMEFEWRKHSFLSKMLFG
jgi:hypothetical protein